MGLHPWWRVKFRRGSRIWGSPSQQNPSAGTEGKLGGPRREQQPVTGRQDRGNPHRCPKPCTPHGVPEMGVCQCAQGQGEEQVWEGDCCWLWETVWGWQRSSATRNTLGEAQATQKTKHHCWVMCSALGPPLQPPSSRTGPWPPAGTQRGSNGPHSHAPATAASATPHHLGGCSSNCVSAPFCWRGSCASAISGTDSGGRNTYKSRSETIAGPSVHVTNEKSQDLSSWLYKPQSYTSADGLLNSMPAKRSNQEDNKSLCPWDRFSFCSCGLCGQVHIGSWARVWASNIVSHGRSAHSFGSAWTWPQGIRDSSLEKAYLKLTRPTIQ